MQITKMTFLAVTMLFTAAAETARPDPAIEKTAAAYLKAVLAGDAAAVAATYRDDAVEMPDCRPMLKGRAAIEEYYRGFFAGPVKITAFTFSHLETAATSDIGYTTGTYKQTITPKSGGPMEDSGKFVVIVKRGAGVWKAAYVIYNSDRPPVMPPAPAATLNSPMPALMNYLAAVASAWLVRLGWLSLGCVCLGAMALATRSVLRNSGRKSSMANPPYWTIAPHDC